MAAISIIIPVWNRVDYLPRLFRSLASVSYEELEVVLVDNGSTDGSLGLCHSFAESAPMVVTLLEEPQRGAARARNCGLRYCKSEWVYFFDCDDELSPLFLNEIMSNLSDADMVVFPTMQDVGGVVRQRSFHPSAKPSTQILSSTMNTQGMLFRTDFLRQIGGWNDSLFIWDDWELGIRALLHSPRIKWVGQKAYHHIYVHEDSLTGPSMTERLPSILHTLEVVETELLNPRDRRALYFRYEILNGLLMNEGSRPVEVPLSVGLFYRMVGAMLRRYTAKGGKGTWRLAMFFC
ncbi:MAG: glycosyltransferase family 2 protein [Bacteroidaceae bacterium]|nr:glycosyltransferase family 2 protein [Bacteroidaceae bacterium]